MEIASLLRMVLYLAILNFPKRKKKVSSGNTFGQQFTDLLRMIDCDIILPLGSHAYIKPKSFLLLYGFDLRNMSSIQVPR